MYLAENSELNSQADGETSLSCEVAGERDQDDCGSWCDVGIEEATVGATVLARSTNTEVNSLGCEVAGEPDEDDRDSRSCRDVGIEEDTVGAIVLALGRNNELDSRADGETSLRCEVAGELEPDEDDFGSCCDVGIEEGTVGAIVLAFSTNNEVNSRVNGGTNVSVCEVAGEPDEYDCDSCRNVGIEEDTVGVGAIVLAPAMKECPCCTLLHTSLKCM